MSHKLLIRLILTAIFAIFLSAANAALARDWKDADFSNRPVFDYPLPFSPDNVIGSLTEYQIQKLTNCSTCHR